MPGAEFRRRGSAVQMNIVEFTLMVDGIKMTFNDTRQHKWEFRKIYNFGCHC
jgi:hypothetical protein